MMNYDPIGTARRKQIARNKQLAKKNKIDTQIPQADKLKKSDKFVVNTKFLKLTKPNSKKSGPNAKLSETVSLIGSSVKKNSI